MSFEWVDPKWVISGLVFAVSVGAVANYRVADNHTEITKLTVTDGVLRDELHDVELRTKTLETQLDSIESVSKQILEEVRK